MHRLFVAAAGAAFLGFAGLSAADAAPANGIVIDKAANTLDATENVHCRPYRHWHPWGFGHGCHGGGWGHHHHWRRHHHHHHHHHHRGRRH
jgi:hypothetical protein